MAKSQARRAQRTKDVVRNDWDDEEALHEGEDESGISQKGLDRLMRALGPDSLGEMDLALLEQLRGNDEDEGQHGNEEEVEDDEDEEEEEEEKEEEDVEGLIDDEAEEEDVDDDEEDDEDEDEEEDVEGLIDDEAEEEDIDDDEDRGEKHEEMDNEGGKDVSSSAPKDSLAASILRSGLVPDEEEDDDEEEDEDEDEEDEDEDGEEEIPLDSLPSSASLSEQALASRHNRIRINNTEAMQRVYEDMRLDGPSTSGKMPWIETMSLVYEHATVDEVPDAQNDLDRELSFYRQSLAAAVRGRELVLAAKVSFSRPNDYFAEMVKTDEHMERVRVA